MSKRTRKLACMYMQAKLNKAASSIQGLKQRLMDKYHLSKLWIYGQDGDIIVSNITVDPEYRGQGHGQKAMQELLVYADHSSSIVALTPSSDFGSSKSRLTAWYRSLGFVPNKGRNKDFRFSETMIRFPGRGLKTATMPKQFDHMAFLRHVIRVLSKRRIERWESITFDGVDLEILNPDLSRPDDFTLRFPGSSDQYRFSGVTNKWRKSRRKPVQEIAKRKRDPLTPEEREFYNQSPQEIVRVLQGVPKSMLSVLDLRQDLLPPEALRYLTSVRYTFVKRGKGHKTATRPIPLDKGPLTKAARIASKFQNKKKVKKQDGGEMTVYEYSDGQIQHRNREKAKRIEKLRGSIEKLRSQVKKDLTSKDEKTRWTALAIALMDETYERVGNEGSAKEGHFGVTGWQVKHVSFSGSKATVKYVGKSGVAHKKVVSNAVVVKALKAAVKGRAKGDCLTGTSGASDVNAYLKPHNITAKDLRGLHANAEMQSRLKAIRSKGGTLPKDKKEREKKLKEEFAKALEESAAAVGHEPSTLKSQYLVPGLHDQYVSKGKVMTRLDKKAASPWYIHATRTDLAHQIMRSGVLKGHFSRKVNQDAVFGLEDSEKHRKAALAWAEAKYTHFKNVGRGGVALFRYKAGRDPDQERRGESIWTGDLRIHNATLITVKDEALLQEEMDARYSKGSSSPVRSVWLRAASDIPSGFLEGSKFKDTLYHGSSQRIQPGYGLRPDLGSEYGIYLSPNHRYARMYGSNLYRVLANFKKPLVVEGKHEISPADLTKKDIRNLQAQGYDAVVSKSGSRIDEVVLFDPKQAWVLESRSATAGSRRVFRIQPKGKALPSTSRDWNGRPIDGVFVFASLGEMRESVGLWAESELIGVEVLEIDYSGPLKTHPLEHGWIMDPLQAKVRKRIPLKRVLKGSPSLVLDPEGEDPAQRVDRRHRAAKEGITLKHWGLEGLVEGKPVTLYHGTTKSFRRFDMSKNRDELVNKFYGRGIFLVPQKSVAGQYADANRNIGFDASIIDVLKRKNPVAGLFLQDLHKKGYKKAWDDLLEAEGFDEDKGWAEGTSLESWESSLNGIDPNSLSDLSPYILGSKDKLQGGGGALSMFSTNTGLPVQVYNLLDEIGIDSKEYRPKVYTVSVNVDNPLVTSSKSEAKKARAKGYDCVVFYGSDLIGGVPEVAVFDGSKVKIQKVELW